MQPRASRGADGPPDIPVAEQTHGSDLLLGHVCTSINLWGRGKDETSQPWLAALIPPRSVRPGCSSCTQGHLHPRHPQQPGGTVPSPSLHYSMGAAAPAASGVSVWFWSWAAARGASEGGFPWGWGGEMGEVGGCRGSALHPGAAGPCLCEAAQLEGDGTVPGVAAGAKVLG